MPNTIAISGVISKAAQLAHSMGLIFKYWKTRRMRGQARGREDRKQRKNHLKTSLLTTYYILLTITSGLLLTTNLFSQETEGFRQYTTEDGLVHDIVNSIYQDSRGYLWFCTDGGVSRFNGYEFRNYTKADGLGDNIILLANEDELGRIWFASLTNELFYFYNDSIYAHQYNNNIAELNIPPCYKFSIVIRSDTVQIGTMEHGYYEINKEGNTRNIVTPEGTNLIQSQQGDLIYSVTMTDLSKPTININRQPYRYDFYNYPGKGVVWLKIVDDQIFLLDGGKLFAMKGDSLQILLKVPGVLSDVHGNRDAGYYFSVYNSEAIYFRELPIIDSFTKGSSQKLPWKSDRTMIDFEGNVWMSSQGQGAFKATIRFDLIKAETLIFNDHQKINEIILADDGKVVVNYNNRYAKISNVDGGLSDVFFPKLDWAFEQLFFIMKNGETISYEGAWNTFHNEIKSKGWHDSLCPKSQNRLSGLYGTSLSNFWIEINSKGYFHFENNRLTAFVTGSKPSGTLSQSMAYQSKSLYFKRDSRNFVAAYTGGIYEMSDGQLNLFQMDNKYLDDLFNDIVELDRSTFLFAGTNNGLVILQNDSIYSITREDGLSSNMVNCIAVDADGVIWAGTANGLNKINLRNKSVIQVLGVLQGLPSDNVTALALRGEELWVGTSKGLVILDRTKIKLNKTPPFIHITGFKVDEVDTTLLNHYEFEHDQNYFVIEYTGIAYNNAGNLDYEYQLEGLDKKWLQTKTRTVRYNKLDPGDYTFRVKAANEDGTWSKTATMSFTILPPYWQTWWFRVLALSLLVLVLGAGFRFRINRIREIAEQQKHEIDLKRQNVELELKALRAQMNPHFTFNTLNTIQQYISEHKVHEATDYLALFAALIRRVLENSRHNVISLENEINTLKSYLELEQMRFSDRLTFSVEIDENLEPAFIYVPPTLVQPFVENALLHGILPKKEMGHILVSVEQDGERIKWIVEDDGIGRVASRKVEKEKKFKDESLGMKIINERLELLKSFGNIGYEVKITDLEDETNKAKGTRVELWMSAKVNQDI